jgi:hypothetical protein
VLVKTVEEPPHKFARIRDESGDLSEIARLVGSVFATRREEINCLAERRGVSKLELAIFCCVHQASLIQRTMCRGFYPAVIPAIVMHPSDSTGHGVAYLEVVAGGA